MDEESHYVLLRLHGRCYRLLPAQTTAACFQRVHFATLEEYQHFLQPLTHNPYYRHILHLELGRLTQRWLGEPVPRAAQLLHAGLLELHEVIPSAAPRGEPTEAPKKKSSLAALSTALDVAPVTGPVKSALQVLLGFDPLTGESVHRGVELVGIVAGLIPGGKAIIKAGKRGKKATTKAGSKPSPKFQPTTNPPQMPPKDIPPGWRVREMPPTEQYPNGYWKLEKPMSDGSWQPIIPANRKPGSRPETHIPFPPKKK